MMTQAEGRTDVMHSNKPRPLPTERRPADSNDNDVIVGLSFFFATNAHFFLSSPGNARWPRNCEGKMSESIERSECDFVDS